MKANRRRADRRKKERRKPKPGVTIRHDDEKYVPKRIRGAGEKG